MPQRYDIRKWQVILTNKYDWPLQQLGIYHFKKTAVMSFDTGEGHAHLQAIQNTSKFQGEPGPCSSIEEQGGMAVTVKGRLTDSKDFYMFNIMILTCCYN